MISADKAAAFLMLTYSCVSLTFLNSGILSKFRLVLSHNFDHSIRFVLKGNVTFSVSSVALKELYTKAGYKPN